jgi:hypothetical protein
MLRSARLSKSRWLCESPGQGNSQGIRIPAAREMPERKRIEERAREGCRNNEEQWMKKMSGEGKRESSDEEKGV